MTDFKNGHHPRKPVAQNAGFGRDTHRSENAQFPRISGAAKRAGIHPEQAHLNTLIHAKIVTHLVHVDEVPDTLFALSQMQDLPEVRFAAIFDDGLIALGCPTNLPEALATIAVPAIPTEPANIDGLQRIEQVSRRLETMVNAMEPEEVILSDQLGKSILDRLTSLETRVTQAQSDPIMAQLSAQVATLQENLAGAPAIAALEAKLNDILRRINNTTPTAEIEKMVKTLARSAQTTPSTPLEAETVTERIDQLSAAQRTAFARIEAAMTKAVSGLQPALDHLSARAADTENMMLDWHKDLKTLSQHTRSIADSTGRLPPVFTALQSDVTTLANKPAPVLDLTAQQEGFAHFSSDLRRALTDYQKLAQLADERATKTAVRADETIAALRTLPTLVSDAQILEFEGLQNAVKSILSELHKLGDGVNGLHANGPDLDPIKELIDAVAQQITNASEDHQGQLDQLRKTLTGLAQHLGVAAQKSTSLVASSPLVPDTSLNTLRMEFADLITKRIKENNAPFTGHSRQA